MRKISVQREEFYFLQALRYRISKKFVSVIYYVVIPFFWKKKSGQDILTIHPNFLIKSDIQCKKK